MAMARPRYEALDRMSRSQMEAVLYEANLGLEDTKLARRYFVDRVPQIDVAMELGLDRKTVGNRLRRIEKRVAHFLGKSTP